MNATEKLKELAAKVPGLAGFLEREDLREQDKALREHTAERMGKIKDGLAELKRALLDQMKIGLLDDVDRLGQKVDRLRDKHRFAAYGFTGALDKRQVNQTELQAMLDADVGIHERVESVVELCASWCADDADEADVKAAMATRRVELKDLETLMESRGGDAENSGK